MFDGLSGKDGNTTTSTLEITTCDRLFQRFLLGEFSLLQAR